VDDLQEVILDRLIGATAADFRDAPGPVGLAWRALRDAGLTERTTPALALGFSQVLCQALQEAGACFTELERQREFALAVFAELPPRPKPPHLTAHQHLEIALWCARSAHAFVCLWDCPVAEDLAVRIRCLISGERPDRLGLFIPDALWTHCSCQNATAPPEIDAIHALEMARRAAVSHCCGTWPGHSCQKAAGFAARGAALTHGVSGAIDFCLALARLLEVRSADRP
jgi:hypothetical protein